MTPGAPTVASGRRRQLLQRGRPERRRRQLLQTTLQVTITISGLGGNLTAASTVSAGLTDAATLSSLTASLVAAGVSVTGATASTPTVDVVLIVTVTSSSATPDSATAALTAALASGALAGALAAAGVAGTPTAISVVYAPPPAPPFPPPAAPGTASLAELAAQLAALQAALLPAASCGGGSFLQYNATAASPWGCTQLLGATQPGRFCRAKSGVVVCDQALVPAMDCSGASAQAQKVKTSRDKRMTGRRMAEPRQSVYII